MPSYSSGVDMPRKPSLPSSSSTSRAKCAVRSHSAACGSIRVRANSRARSTIWRCVSERPAASIAIDIEAATGLAAQAPRRDHLSQQRRGTVLGIAEIVVEDVEDVETHIEADQVRQGWRPDRVVHPQSHDLIY